MNNIISNLIHTMSKFYFEGSNTELLTKIHMLKEATID